MSANEKAELWKEVVAKITDTGVVVQTTTFDGLQTNFSAMRMLGASFILTDFRPAVENPVNKTQIKIILDACHMLKLLRNCLQEKLVLYDNEKRKIEWKYFERLVLLRDKGGLITHKLNKKHIDKGSNRMKVNLAAELFSRKVANSMEYLMNAGYDQFADCSATINFVRIINDLFDIFNTSHEDTLQKNNGNIYKVPINLNTAPQILPFLDLASKYIASISLRGVNILNTNRKTGFLGFLINIHNLKQMIAEDIQTKKISNIPTYSLGQDALESVFGRIRSKLGDNNNPTAEQFKANFRKILINREIRASNETNCRDKLNILQIPSTSRGYSISNTPPAPESGSDNIEPFSSNDYLLNSFEDATIVNIAANIEHKIQQQYFNCDLCSNILNENTIVADDSNTSVNFRSPCVSTTYICKVAKKYFELYSKQIEFKYYLLFEAILDQIDFDAVYCNSNFNTHEEHKKFFVDFVVEEYIVYTMPST